MSIKDDIIELILALRGVFKKWDKIWEALRTTGYGAAGGIIANEFSGFLSTSEETIVAAIESLQNTVKSIFEAITGDPAAREKIDRLDEIAEKRKRLAELNAESEASDASGPRDISAQVGLAADIGALEKEAAAVKEAPRAADDLIVPDGRLITGSLVPGVAGGGISIPESAGQAFDALDATLERVDKSMSDVFANMAVGGASAADELSRIFASLDSDILGSLGGLGSLISRFLGGGPASFLGSLFGLAGGGTVQPGTPILVGERGPEIFLPSGPGRVLNAHTTARAMGGAGAGGQQPLVVQQTINFSTDVRNSVRAEVLNALPLATNIAAQQVADMLRGIRR